MKHTVGIQNVKCGGCAKTIRNSVSEIEGVGMIHVDHDAHTISFESNEDTVPLVVKRLDELGYPVDESDNSLVKKAKSFVSCARGRVS